jgi:hypothetical protein
VPDEIFSRLIYRFLVWSRRSRSLEKD